MLNWKNCFLIVGILLTVFGIKLFKNDIAFKEIAAETTATITRIDRHGSFDDESYDVYVKFMVNDEYYQGELDLYSSNMHVGGTTQIYYNPDNPEDFKSKSGTDFVSILIIILGVAFTVAGIFINEPRKR